MCRRILRLLVQNAYEQHSTRREYVMEQRVAEQLLGKNRNVCAQMTREWRSRVQELAQERRSQAERCKRREQMQVVLEAASRRALEHNGCDENSWCDTPDGQEHGAHALCAGTTSRQRSPQSQGHAAQFCSIAPEGADLQHGTDRGVHPESGCDSIDVLSEEDPHSAGNFGRASGSGGSGRKRTSEQNVAFHKSCHAMAERQVTQVLLKD
jgi:hypothetical protein